MSFDRAGPPLETLTHRLAETPREFLDEPRIGGRGQVAVAALVNDLTSRLGLPANPALFSQFDGQSRTADRNRLSLAAVMVWLLHDDWFAHEPVGEADLAGLLGTTLAALAAAGSADRYATQPDRREELVRTALAAFGARPDGETPQQAADRLTSVSGAERRRLLQASRAAEERSRAVREALVRKAAQESADKWTRE
jgi:hypothetical protein